MKKLFLYSLLIAALISCTKFDNGDLAFTNTGEDPANVSSQLQITQDNSGLVSIKPTAQGVAYYDVYFGHGQDEPIRIAAGNTAQHNYPEGVYTIKVIAYNLTGGKSSEFSQEVEVSYTSPQDLVVNVDIDVNNKFKVDVTATALHAASFQVRFGEEEHEEPTTFIEGQTASHTYQHTGTYTVTVVALSGGEATTTFSTEVSIVNPLYLPLDFESPAGEVSFSNFDGGDASVIDNPFKTGLNTSAKVGKMVKYGGQPWGGSVISLGGPIDFASGKTFRMKVYSPRVGAKVLLKVENASNPDISYEKELSTTVANAWEELQFDYADIDAAQDYNNVVLIFELGTMGDGSPDFTFYFDDIELN